MDKVINQCKFSKCRQFRYTLTRVFENGKGTCSFIGLNPSTADEYQNDPTVSRCMNRAQQMGFKTFIMLNAYGYRATDPKDMKAHPSPVGEENDYWILESCKKSDKIICCWGNHASHLNRSDEIRELLKDFNLFRLGDPTASGEPRHPLYLPKQIEVQAMIT